MRTISMIVFSGVMFLLHIMLAPALEIVNAKIDFIMISILLLAVFSKKWYPSVLCGVYSGLAVDIYTQANTYINTGIYLFFGLLYGGIFYFIKKPSFTLTSLTALISVALKHMLFVFVLYVMRLSSSLTLGTFFYGIPSAIYTGIVALGLYFVYKGYFSFSFMEEKNEDSGKFLI